MATNKITCGLCFDTESENSPVDDIIRTNCGHLFHSLCLQPIYDGGYTSCPSCKKTLKADIFRNAYDLEVINATKLASKMELEKTPEASTSSLPPLNEHKFLGTSSLVSADPEDPPETESLLQEPTALTRNFTDPSQLAMYRYHEKCDYRFKVVILGDSNVGKSSLLQRYVGDSIHPSQMMPAVECDWRCKTVTIDNRVCNLCIWDTVGSEQHRSLRLKMQNAHAILFCYDISNASSFKNIESWIKFAERYSVLDFAKIIIGNKIDLAESRVITKGDAQSLSKKHGIPHFETSAKDESNVKQIFLKITAQILENDQLVQNVISRAQNPRISLHEDHEITNNHQSSCIRGWLWTKYQGNRIAHGIYNGLLNISTRLCGSN